MKKLIILIVLMTGILSVSAQNLTVSSSLYNRVTSQSSNQTKEFRSRQSINTRFDVSEKKGFKFEIKKVDNTKTKFSQPFTKKELKRDLNMTTNNTQSR